MKEYTNINQSLDLLLSHISERRSYLMGIAIIMVIFYHFFCWVYNPIGSFNIGYAGVDIFLFLSGFGLAHSYSHNSIRQFYYNRFKRIYPTYALAVIATFIIFNTNWDSPTLLSNLVGVGLYIDGGINQYDWYLESLLGLYLLFPILYKYGKTGLFGVIILTLIIATVLYAYEFSWWYDCIIGRLPIFIYGIVFSTYRKHIIPIILVGVILFLPCRHFISSFLATSLLVLPIIIIALKTVNKLPITITKIIERCGKHSLEIYIANLFVYYALSNNEQDVLTKTLIFISLQSVATIAFCIFSSCVNRIFTCISAHSTRE